MRRISTHLALRPSLAPLTARLRWLPAALFIIAVPVFLITASVAWAFNSPGLYRGGFEKYDISLRSGITEEGLDRVARELRGYFNSGKEPLSIRARVFGEERELFNAKEVAHMRDVKRLVWGVYLLAAVSGAYLLASIALGFATRRVSYLDTLAGRAAWGGGVTVALLVLFGLLATVAFDAIFLLFHRISFANDFWQLDPRRDYLVILFPQGFWFDATLWFALRAIAAGLILAAAGGGYLTWRRRSLAGTNGRLRPGE